MIPTCQAWIGLEPPVSVTCELHEDHLGDHQAWITGDRRDEHGKYHDHPVKVRWG